MRQKIIVCAEIYDGLLLAELPSRSPVDTAIDSDDDTILALAVVTDNLTIADDTILLVSVSRDRIVVGRRDQRHGYFGAPSMGRMKRYCAN